MKADKQTILVVEDDEALMLGLVENLKFAGYEVLSATDGSQGVKVALESKPDLMLLDIMLPGMSGYEVCREIRSRGADMPIVMLTARQDEFDKLHGFETGADDYVTKPFSVNELLARIKAILLRGRARPAASRKYEFEDFVLDLDARVLKKKDKDIPLTKTEFDLLTYFCTHEGKALSREMVMTDVWGMEYYGTQRSLDSFVASLRSKIEKKTGKPEHILTVHGVGYKFVK
jgi:two-component system alkaline phosphatase synthesis response regulator PhoP